VDPFSIDAVRGAYDATVTDYVAAFGDDLDRLPIDRNVLDLAVTAAPREGWVLEAGCGPAPAARHLGDRAPQIVGADVSEPMLRAARARTPHLRGSRCDLRRLPLRDGSCALVIAYYCLQHLPRIDLPLALAEVHRVLRTDGVLAVGAHLGEGDVFVDEFLGHEIATLGGVLYTRDDLVGEVARAGFRIELEQHRDPLPHEADTRRIYLIARSPLRLRG
jgi:SAM-dependent methyltransferase